MRLQPSQPHSSAVPVLEAQTGNEKVPFEPHLAVRLDALEWSFDETTTDLHHANS